MTRISIGAQIRMKRYWTKLHKGKRLGLVIFLLILALFLYQEIQPYISSYTAYKKSDSTPFIQISLSKEEIQAVEKTYPIEVSMVSFEQLKQFAINDYNSPIFEQDGSRYEIVYNDKEISHLQLSTDQKKLGFYLHFPEGDTVFEKTVLVIMDIEKKNFKKISEGDLKVSNWKWKNNDQFIIYINCGTGCHLAHVYSVNDGRLIAEYLDKEI